jgi:hypothetical protein
MSLTTLDFCQAIENFRDKDTDWIWNREPSKRLSAELQRIANYYRLVVTLIELSISVSLVRMQIMTLSMSRLSEIPEELLTAQE